MTRQLREAVSPDGVTSWRRLDYIPSDDDLPACNVPEELLTQKDGETWLYLFYATQNSYRKGDGVYHHEYDQIKAMRRLVSGQADAANRH